MNIEHIVFVIFLCIYCLCSFNCHLSSSTACFK